MEYLNLKAEMARHNITVLDMSNKIGINEKTMRNKINGITDFTWKQVCKIQNEFFPNLSKDYLFEFNYKN